MKILLVNPNLNLNTPGGDTVQLLATKSALEKMGNKVDILKSDSSYGYSNYDIVHFFNIQKSMVFETVREMLRIRAFGLPIALSTIYWNPVTLKVDESLQQQKHIYFRKRLRQWLEKITKTSILPLSEMESSHQRFIYENLFLEYTRFGVHLSDVLLPNGHGELTQLLFDLSVPKDRIHAHIIPNGVSNGLLQIQPAPDEFRKKWGLKDFVLCVGRVSLVKNQHALIQAMHGLNLPLVCIGQNEGYYADECRKLARTLKIDVKFLGHMPQEHLASAYAAASAHVLPSWRETPGLASLEAAALGCKIVVTPYGTTLEYFENYAWYCQPDNVLSIRWAIVEALNSPKEDGLKDRIRQNYTWDIAAQKTLAAYECVLSTSRLIKHIR